jgi:hypothetical protein
VPVEPSRFASSVVTPQGYKAGVGAPVQPTSYHMISHHSSASFPMAKKKKIEKQIWKNKKGLLSLRGVILLSLLSHGGVELARIEVMQEHLQNLISQGSMTAVELATYRVPTDPASPTLAGGYIVTCAVF